MWNDSKKVHAADRPMQHTALTQTMVELIVMIVFVRILQSLREEPVAELSMIKSKKNAAGASQGYGTASLIRDLAEEKSRQPE